MPLPGHVAAATPGVKIGKQELSAILFGGLRIAGVLLQWGEVPYLHSWRRSRRCKARIVSIHMHRMHGHAQGTWRIDCCFSRTCRLRDTIHAVEVARTALSAWLGWQGGWPGGIPRFPCFTQRTTPPAPAFCPLVAVAGIFAHERIDVSLQAPRNAGRGLGRFWRQAGAHGYADIAKTALPSTSGRAAPTRDI